MEQPNKELEAAHARIRALEDGLQQQVQRNKQLQAEMERNAKLQQHFKKTHNAKIETLHNQHKKIVDFEREIAKNNKEQLEKEVAEYKDSLEKEVAEDKDNLTKSHQRKVEQLQEEMRGLDNTRRELEGLLKNAHESIEALRLQLEQAKNSHREQVYISLSRVSELARLKEEIRNSQAIRQELQEELAKAHASNQDLTTQLAQLMPQHGRVIRPNEARYLEQKDQAQGPLLQENERKMIKLDNALVFTQLAVIGMELYYNGTDVKNFVYDHPVASITTSACFGAIGFKLGILSLGLAGVSATMSGYMLPDEAKKFIANNEVIYASAALSITGAILFPGVPTAFIALAAVGGLVSILASQYYSDNTDHFENNDTISVAGLISSNIDATDPD